MDCVRHRGASRNRYSYKSSEPSRGSLNFELTKFEESNVAETANGDKIVDTSLRQPRKSDDITNNKYPLTNSPNLAAKNILLDKKSSELEIGSVKSRQSPTSLKKDFLDVGHVKKNMSIKGIKVNFYYYFVLAANLFNF